MARFASTVGINLEQAELDFVDVDTSLDNPLYLDPYAIQIREDDWSARCGDHIRSFFNEILDQLRADNLTRVAHLLGNLHEPNETCLGVSKGEPDGKAVGPKKAADLAEALRRSRAFDTGLLSDISEAELFIFGIGPDTISDLTTNILRGLLAEYTLAQCELHSVPTHRSNALGPTWSIVRLDWEAREYSLPRSNNRPILLVPKSSVRRRLSIDSQEFYNHFMVETLRQEYLQAGGALVQTFRNGTRYVTKKSVKERHPKIKDDLAAFVQRHPEVLETYKNLKGARGPLTPIELEEDFDERAFARALVQQLHRIPPGGNTANAYHNLCIGVATFLFHPHLMYPVKEREINEGRKRVDIKFTNAAEIGFFHRIMQLNQTRAASVFIECKNYSSDIGNPELDQLAMRFGPQRGFFGMLFCRTIEDQDWIIASCRDAVHNQRGYMLVFDDDDLIEMLSLVARGQRHSLDHLLQDRFDRITH